MSIHRVSENDNVAIDAIFKTLGRIAGKADIAVEAVHHTRKLGGAAATIEDARGASAQSAAARNVEMLNRMTKDEAASGHRGRRRAPYFRSDSDRNLAAVGDRMVPPSSRSDLAMAAAALSTIRTMSASSSPEVAELI